ncbi:MAG: DNA adenine methylase [Lactobacillales bacterium]|jgi:DNA adenine methylase|nr:DNA adenine methylase [Lactobacillales bacterium]
MGKSGLKPFTKWVGGKRQLLPELIKYMPSEYGTFFEPFIGGGALLFEVEPENALINDFNENLYLSYKVIKENVEQLIEILKVHQMKNSKEYYLDIREVDRDGRFDKMSEVEKAARLMYMLRVDFNGLYRVNSKGQFNVPYGKYVNPKILNEDNLRAISRYLNENNIKVLNGDFEEACAEVKKGDFIYFDPPYAPVNATSAFTSYTEAGFGYDEQVRLRDLFVKLDKLGAKVMMSNSSVGLIHKLYADYAATTVIVGANRMINSKASARGKVDEVIVMNYGESDEE